MLPADTLEQSTGNASLFPKITVFRSPSCAEEQDASGGSTLTAGSRRELVHEISGPSGPFYFGEIIEIMR